MAITYPRELPSYALETCSFELLDGVVAAAYAAGLRINRSQTTDPVWKATIRSIRYGIGERATEQAWTAWNRSLRGGLKTFLAYDKKRENPLAYLAATGPAAIQDGWAGTASVSSIGAGGAVSLTGAAAGYQAKAGDRLGLEQGGRYGYFEILEDVTANGSGAAALTVAPLIPSIFTTAATARLWRPKAEFVIDWQSWRQPSTSQPEPVSFEAYQVL